MALYVKKNEKDSSQWFLKEKSLSNVLFVILASPKNKICTRNIDEIHKKKKQFNCKLYNIGIVRKDHLERHASIVHDGNRSFKCGICDTGFISKEHMNRQVDAIHEKKKTLKFHDSNIDFLRKDHLERHVLIVHEDEKSFKCVTCDNSFTSKQVQKSTSGQFMKR